MNSIVRNREEEVSLAGEVELTDTQLVTVFGAWHNEKHCCHKDSSANPCKKLSRSREVFEEHVKVHFEFDFELEVNEAVDDFGDDWD